MVTYGAKPSNRRFHCPFPVFTGRGRVSGKNNLLTGASAAFFEGNPENSPVRNWRDSGRQIRYRSAGLFRDQISETHDEKRSRNDALSERIHIRIDMLLITGPDAALNTMCPNYSRRTIRRNIIRSADTEKLAPRPLQFNPLCTAVRRIAFDNQRTLPKARHRRVESDGDNT